MLDVKKFAKERGWAVSLTGVGHLRFTKPDYETVFGPGSPSDSRSIANMKAKLLRAKLKPERATARNRKATP